MGNTAALIEDTEQFASPEVDPVAYSHWTDAYLLIRVALEQQPEWTLAFDVGTGRAYLLPPYPDGDGNADDDMRSLYFVSEANHGVDGVFDFSYLTDFEDGDAGLIWSMETSDYLEQAQEMNSFMSRFEQRPMTAAEIAEVLANWQL